MATTVEVGLYVDQHVYSHWGYDPADTLSSLLVDALEYNDIVSYSITVDTDHGFDVRNYSVSGACDLLSDWDDYLKANGLKSNYENHHLIYDHSDMLGGCAWPRISVSHGDMLSQIDSFNPPRYNEMARGASTTTAGDAAMACMQEVGHTLGLCDGSDHNCGMHYDDTYSVKGDPVLPGDGNDVYTTSMGAAKDGYNQCSEWSEDFRDYDVEYNDAYYWYNCAGAQLRTLYN